MALKSLGQDGFLSIAQSVMDTTVRIRDAIIGKAITECERMLLGHLSYMLEDCTLPCMHTRTYTKQPKYI